jgi:hypothetical protein
MFETNEGNGFLKQIPSLFLKTRLISIFVNQEFLNFRREKYRNNLFYIKTLSYAESVT